MPLEVTLIDHARDPLQKLYGAYRTCYTQKTPKEVWDEIREGKTAPEVIRKFVQERLATGHVSPLEQVVFWFGISGVSRALSHQFVRHRVGISFEQQSQRYVRYKENKLDFVEPRTITGNAEAALVFHNLMDVVKFSYERLVALGIPNEDARFVLPNAMPTNFQVMVNLAELLHIGDLRLCHRAQWEIRYMVGLMRAALRKEIPELAAVMQPKCGEHRLGYCDESEKDYLACPLSKVRPHKQKLLELYQHATRGGARSLTDDDIQPMGQP
jgi:thymidylate synthase (FAD)